MNHPATQSRRLRALLAIDAALLLDTSLRWELGVSFVRPAWLGAVLGSLLVLSLVSRLVESKLLLALLTFPLWCGAFILASTGNPHFDWRSVPVVDFFRTSWLDYWLGGGGFLTAGIAAAAHACLAPRWLPRPSQPAADDFWARRALAALLVTACVAFLPVVEITAPVSGPGDPPYTVRLDPRDPSGTLRSPFEWVRRGTWAVLVIGGAVGLRRRRAGSVAVGTSRR